LIDSSNPDEELLERARLAPEGDYRAFEQLVRRHQKKVVANCRYLTRNPGCAEDLAQEVFVKAYFGLTRYEGRASFRTWLQRIKINHCFNYLKKQQGKVFVDAEDDKVKNADGLVLQPAAERAMIARSERERITIILDAMPGSLRIPLLMRDMDQLPYEEVAASLGISLSAVKMRIKRGREEFRRRYRELSGEMDPPPGHGRH
jgi:RNA polymerase sigma-70 factor (ECF subfamily)